MTVEKNRHDLRRFRQYRSSLRFLFEVEPFFHTEAVFRQLELADQAISFLESKLRHGAGTSN